jgi:glycosyltransferase involved in cell wall biosynthesis
LKNVKTIGLVNDINDVFKDIDIGIYPILLGGGIKTKVIETMAAGIPIITTSEGIRGLKNLNSNSVIVEDDINNYGYIIENTLLNFNLRLSLSESASKYIVNNHTYDKLKMTIHRLYADL